MTSTPAAGRTWRGTVLVAVAAIAVVAVVLGVRLATDGTAGTGTGRGTAPASGTSDPAAELALFPADDEPAADTTRRQVVEPTAPWPLGACDALEDDAREGFVHGTETGPEYQRELAVGWYPDGEAAQAAYERIRDRVEGCATASAADVDQVPLALGDDGLVATVAEPGLGDETPVTTSALVRSGEVVVLVVDHATFHTPPDPATTLTPGHAERLLAEACRVTPERC